MIGRLGIVAAVAAALAASGCKSEKKRRVQELSRERDGAAVVMVSGPSASGALVAEAEPNDEAAAAQVIELGGGVRGTLASETDVDLYAVTPAESGMLSVLVPGIDGVDLVVELRDAKNKMLFRSDRGPARMSEGLANAPVAAGERYLIAVSEFVRKRRRKGETPREGESPPYSLRASLATAAEARFETEPNQEADGAALLAVGDERFGFFGWHDDVDRWHVDVTGLAEGDAPEGIDLALVGVERVVPRLVIRLADGTELASRTGAENGSVDVLGLVPPAGASHLVVEVGGKRSNPEQPYSLQATARTLGDDDEIEPNDTAERAQPLEAGDGTTSRRGAVTGGDVDQYRLSAAPESRLVDVQVRPSADTDVTVELVSASGASLGRSEIGSRGAAERVDGVSVAAGDELVVRVTGSGTARDPGRYELIVSVVPSAGFDPMPVEQPEL